MSVGIDFLMEQINGGPLPGRDVAAEGWREPESPLTTDAAADEWSRQLAADDFYESGAEMVALQAEQQRALDRAYSIHPGLYVASVERTHTATRFGDGAALGRSVWRALVSTGSALDPRSRHASGEADTADAAVDAAIAELLTRINAAISLAFQPLLAPAAVVAAEGRAA